MGEEKTTKEPAMSAEIDKELSDLFESNISRLLGDAGGNPLTPEQIQQTFQRMAEAVQQILTNSGEISDLSANFACEQNGFLPFMQGMMQGLLSKDVLYPSLKDILEKYHVWFQHNAGTLSTEDKQRYEMQQKLMEEVCKELEMENKADSAEVKRQRFEKVLSLLQKLQDYGQPPTELVGNVGPGLQFPSQGNPDQCNTM